MTYMCILYELALLTITNTSISIPLNLLEKSLYKTMSNEEMDELETCIKREILSIHVKHRERKYDIPTEWNCNIQGRR